MSGTVNDGMAELLRNDRRSRSRLANQTHQPVAVGGRRAGRVAPAGRRPHDQPRPRRGRRRYQGEFATAHGTAKTRTTLPCPCLASQIVHSAPDRLHDHAGEGARLSG